MWGSKKGINITNISLLHLTVSEREGENQASKFSHMYSEGTHALQSI